METSIDLFHYTRLGTERGRRDLLSARFHAVVGGKLLTVRSAAARLALSRDCIASGVVLAPLLLSLVA